MVEVEIDGEKRKAVYSALTAMLYEQEFGGADIYADVYAGFGTVADGENGFRKAFAQIKTTTLYKALWAGLKAADDEVPPFSEWARGDFEINRFEVADAVLAEMNRRCFRAGAGASA